MYKVENVAWVTEAFVEVWRIDENEILRVSSD